MDPINDKEVLPSSEFDGETDIVEGASGLNDGIVVVAREVEGKWNVESKAGQTDGGSRYATGSIGRHDGIGESRIFFVRVGQRWDVSNHIVVPIEFSLWDEERGQEVHVIGGEFVHRKIVELKISLIDDVVSNVAGPPCLVSGVGYHLRQFHPQPNIDRGSPSDAHIYAYCGMDIPTRI